VRLDYMLSSEHASDSLHPRDMPSTCCTDTRYAHAPGGTPWHE
jgi:hypothetical protein